MSEYPVDLISLDNGDIMVRFPDVPEAITYGETEELASEQAKDALVVALSGYVDDGKDIPEPSEPKPGQKTVRAPVSFGEEAEKDSIPWREVFPELAGQPEYSVCLRGARNKENITQTELAKLTGISQEELAHMEKGELEIGEERAKVLGKALNVNHRIFL